MANKSSQPTLSSADLAQFSQICRSISNDLADERGFVSIRSLLKRFQASLNIRPLLVEGMLVSKQTSSNKENSSSKWIVFIDHDTYPVDESDVLKESWGNPLPQRMRFTVAHELAHSLAFRPTEYGLRLNKSFMSQKGQLQLAVIIERETDRLSPLLLWPEKTIDKLTKEVNSSLTVEMLTDFSKNFGLSRYALINRFNLLKKEGAHDLIQRPAFRNMAIGIGKWISSSRAVFLNWPLFHNFDRGFLPEFLIKIKKENGTPADLLFGDKNFAAVGGTERTLQMKADARTLDSTIAEKMEVKISIEDTGRKPDSNFLYVVNKYPT